MKITYVVKRFPKLSETFVLREIEEVISQGDDVEICSLEAPYPGELRHDGVDRLVARTIYVPSGRTRPRRLRRAAGRMIMRHPWRALGGLAWSVFWTVRERDRAHLRRFGEACWLAGRITPPDHIHAHFANGSTTVAMLLAYLTNRPFSFTGHARDIFEHVRPALLRAKVKRAEFVVTISEHTRAHLHAIVRPRDRAKVVVVRNGVDRSRFIPRAGEPAGPPVVVAVGRLVEKKGIDTLVDACAVLAARALSFRCEIIGDGPLREEMVVRARRAGLNGEFALLGERSSSEVRAALAGAHVFVLPSRPLASGDRDGLPVAIVEAMTVGVPVVSTTVSAIPEVVVDGDTGLLVPPDDPVALADALELLLTDDGLRALLAANARSVVEHYDLTECVAGLRSHFAGRAV